MCVSALILSKGITFSYTGYHGLLCGANLPNPEMKNNKIEAEEQDTDKHCSERKACRQKWLATLCLSLGRHECTLYCNLCC